jgi:protein SCO1/2
MYTANIRMKTALVSLSLMAAILAGCSQAPAPKAAPTEYQATGEILGLDPAAQTAKINAGKIDGWMEAMTMDFPIKDKQEFDKLRVGETIRAKVFVQGTDYWLAGITEVPAAKEPAANPK